MLSLDGERKSEYLIAKATGTAAPVKARRKIHTLSQILVYEFMQDRWKRVRWYHAVVVAERWIQALDLMPEKKAVKTEGMASGEEEDVSEDLGTRLAFNCT